MNSRDVVITGVGVVSPIGIGSDAYWKSLLEGQSGVTAPSQFDASALPVRLAAEVQDFEPKRYVRPRKSLKVMSRETQMAFAAADMAMEQAQLAPGGIDPTRLGCVFACEFPYTELVELADAYKACMVDGKFQHDLWGERAMTKVQPLWLLKNLPNMAGCHVGISQDAQGPNNSITLGEVSGLLAIIEAKSVIQRGLADAVLVGGTGSRLSVTAILWRGEELMSHRNDDPPAASRPFDLARDGMVNGEGAGVLLLEDAAHARRRGANVLARVLSGSSTCAPYRNKRPPVHALRNALRHIVQRAEVKVSDIGHVNANGLSTKYDDAGEAQAIREEYASVPVTALKGHFGNLGAAAAVVETAASVFAIQHGRIPPTLNYQTPDPACPVEVVQHPTESDKPLAAILNFNRTGQVAAVMLGKP